MSQSLQQKLFRQIQLFQQRRHESAPGSEPVYTIDELHEVVVGLLKFLEVASELWNKDRFRVRTIRYYRSEGVVQPPEGQTSNARYGWRHVLEVATARLAGHVGRWSLSQAAQKMEGLDDEQLTEFVAELATQAHRENDNGHRAVAAEMDEVVGHRRAALDSPSSSQLAESADRYGRGQAAFMSASPSFESSSPREEETADLGSVNALRSADTPSNEHTSTSLTLDLPGTGQLSLPTDHPLVQSPEARERTRRRVARALEELAQEQE